MVNQPRRNSLNAASRVFGDILERKSIRAAMRMCVCEFELNGTTEMNRQQKPELPKEEPPQPEIQQGEGRSIVTDERLKRLIKQHPQRDEPKVDSIEPGESRPK